MQAGVGHVSDVMPIYMIISLNIVITMRFFINCPTVICLPAVCYLFEIEAYSENYGPRVYFNHIKNTKYIWCNFISFILFCNLSIYHYEIWSLQLTRSRGLTTLLPALGASICSCVCRSRRREFTWFSYWFDNLGSHWGKILSTTILLHPSSSGKIQT